MARPESRFISKLTKAQVQKLEELRDDGANARIRHRAHAILLSFQGAIDASIAIACINSFAAKLTRPTTLVIDNAPIHTSTEFQLMIPEWERQNLCLCFLPPYSPELNLIEILWKKIKYDWLPLESYESFGHLIENLAHVLATIGKEFKIAFQ